jgi:hypothetical protein
MFVPKEEACRSLWRTQYGTGLCFGIAMVHALRMLCSHAAIVGLGWWWSCCVGGVVMIDGLLLQRSCTACELI